MGVAVNNMEAAVNYGQDQVGSLRGDLQDVVGQINNANVPNLAK